MSASNDLLRQFSVQQCCCVQPIGSGLVSFCPGTRQTKFHRTAVDAIVCVPCRAREALEADGIELDPVAQRRKDERQLTLAQRLSAAHERKTA